MNTDVALAIAVAGPGLAVYLSALGYAAGAIIRSPDLDGVGQALWIGALVLFPVIAAIVWFVAGPRPLSAVLRLSRR